MDFEFKDEDLAGSDAAADRLSESGAYKGAFKQVYGFEASTGARGMAFEFEAADGQTCRFDLYVEKEGRALFGKSLVAAIASLLGARALKGVPGRVTRFGEEIEAPTYPALCGKPIGIVLQKELTSKQSGEDSYRMNLVGSFHPTSQHTATELKTGVKPAKLANMLRNLKTKDSRKRAAGAGDATQASAPSYEGL